MSTLISAASPAELACHGAGETGTRGRVQDEVPDLIRPKFAGVRQLMVVLGMREVGQVGA